MLREHRLIGIALLLVGLACGVVSTAIDYWFYLERGQEGEQIDVFFGLWESCARWRNGTYANGSIVTVCKTWSEVEDRTDGTLDIEWLHGCQAMMIIGSVLNAATLLGTVLAYAKHTTTGVAPIVALIAGICYTIAAAIFIAKYTDILSNEMKDGHLHAGFALAIASGIFNLIPTCLVVKGSKGEEYQHIQATFQRVPYTE